MLAMPEYELFISYARADNVPDTSGRGWVTGIKELIETDSRALQGKEYRIFFDVSDIHTMQDWRARIQGALRTSKVMLVCLSPNYFASAPCRWEWEEYEGRAARMLAKIGVGADDQGTLASVFFADQSTLASVTSQVSSGIDAALGERWRKEVLRHHGVDLLPWFPDGAKALELEEVRSKVLALGTDIWSRIERSREVEEDVGNLMRFNPYFVGRHEELEHLNSTIRSPGAIGTVTIAHGPGGLGKTELVVQYAHAFRALYAGGVWMLRAEGHKDILELAASLAQEPEFGFTPTDSIAHDSRLLGRAVLAELLRRARRSSNSTSKGDVLVFLDNVSNPGLLSEPQVANLPKDPHLRFVATTRLGESDFGSVRGVLGFVPLSELRFADALTLIKDHQPVRNDGLPGFADQEQERAANEIVDVLGGLTLAVEQAAIFLGAHPSVTPTQFLDTLVRHGAASVESGIIDVHAVKSGMRHEDKAVQAVLAEAMNDLDPVAVSAIQVAAFLPPDRVPWPWLREITDKLHPQPVETLFSPEARWARTQRVLSGRRLLTATSEPDVARIHRLFAAHARQSAGPEVRDSVTEFLGYRSEQMADPETLPDPWEYSALLEALQLHVREDSRLTHRVVESGVLYELGAQIQSAQPSLLGVELTRLIEHEEGPHPADQALRGIVAQAHLQVASIADDWLPDKAAESSRRSVELIQELGEYDAASGPEERGELRDALKLTLFIAASNLEQYDPELAMDYARRAVDLAEQDAREDPGDIDRQSHLCSSLVVAARCAEDLDPKGARDMAERALAIAERLKDEPGGQEGLSSSLTALGGLLIDIEPERGENMLRRALAIDEAITGPSGSPSRALAQSLADLASAIRRANPAAALDLEGRALVIRQKIVDAKPEDFYARRKLAASLDSLSRLRSRTNPTGGLALAESALRIREQLVAEQPADLMAKESLAISLDIVAQESPDPARSKLLSHRALRIREELLIAQPGSPGAKKELAVSYNNVARMTHDDDPDGALALARKALDLCQDVVDAEPENLQAKRDLLYPLDTVADFLQEEDWRQAMPYRRRLLDTREAIYLAQPDSGDDSLRLCQALRDMANLIRNDDAEAALAMRRRAVAMGSRAIEKAPDDLFALHEHAINEVLFADALPDGAKGEAMGHYTSALEIFWRLSESLPDDEETHVALAKTLVRTARTLEAWEGPGPGSHRHWTDACTLLKRMERQFGLDSVLEAARQEACSKASAPQPTRQRLPPPGWYSDPAKQAHLRYWDGRAWTDHTHTY